MPVSIIEDFGPQASSCGYCGSKDDTSLSHGMWCHQLSTDDYAELVTRGWRRCGYYMYKPNLKDSCCPCYTIRLRGADFKPSKSQKKVATRIYRYLYGERPGPDDMQDATNGSASAAKKPAMKNVQWDSVFKEAFNGGCGTAHKLEIKTVKAEVTPEGYQLYKGYQMAVHKDPEDKVTEQGYSRFLIASCLMAQPAANPTPTFPGYGTYHQNYYLDGKLIITCVIDLLPTGQSSVYSFYDTAYGFLSPGVLSGLGELFCVRENYKANKDFSHYFLGFYIHNCPKMKYKADFKPSELLCPETYDWVPVADVAARLNETPYQKLSSTDLPDTSYINRIESTTMLYQRSLRPFGMILPEIHQKNKGKDEKTIADTREKHQPQLEAWRGAVGPKMADTLAYVSQSLPR